MRGLLASSIGVTCAAALALPLAPPAFAAAAAASPAVAAPVPAAPLGEAAAARARVAAPHSPRTPPSVPSVPSVPGVRTVPDAPAVPAVPDASAVPDVAGSTRSLPLVPLVRDRAVGGATAEQGLPRRTVAGFSLLGVVWDDPHAELRGRVQVRTRAAGTDAWSDWRELEPDGADHGADPDSPEAASGRVRGGTAPLWVGPSDGVEVRVRPEAADRSAPGTRSQAVQPGLPEGLRLDLVNPGTAPSVPAAGRHLPVTGTAHGRLAALSPLRSAGTLDVPDEASTVVTPAVLSAQSAAASAANADLAPIGATDIPALDRSRTVSELLSLRGAELTEAQRAKPYIGPRPRIVTRRGWGADEKLRERKFVYTKKVKAAFVHHTVTGNTYKCSQAPSLIRGMYRYHVKSMGWRDIGYNFLVDKCGNIYEGRAGGVSKPVMGAHTLGFNTNSTGIAVIGTFGSSKPPAAAVKAVAKLTAWKLGLYGANPKGRTYLTSGGGNLYRKGKKVRLHVISGHRDGFATECPGRQLYGKLGSARSTAARLQGR